MNASNPRRETAVLGLVSVAHGASHYFIFSLPTILAFMVLDPSLAHLEMNFVKAGLVVSAFSIASGVFQFFMGVAADRIGVKPVLFGGLTLLAGGITLMGLADSYWMLLVLAFIAGTGNSVFHPADYAVLGANMSAPRLAKAYAVHTFAGYVGFAVGPFVSGLLAAAYGWQTAFIAGGLAGLAIAALLVSQQRLIISREKPAEPGLAAAGAAIPIRAIIFAPPILMMFVFYMLSGGLSIGLNSAVAGALSTLWTIDLKAAAWAVSAFMAGGSVGTLVGGTVAMKYKRLDLVAFAGYGVSGVLLCLIATVSMPYAAVLAAFCFAGFMYAIITPSRDMMVKSLTPAGNSGKVFGFVSSGFEMGGILLAPIFGWLIDHKMPASVFYAAAAIMALAYTSAVLAMRLHRRPALQPAAAE